MVFRGLASLLLLLGFALVIAGAYCFFDPRSAAPLNVATDIQIAACVVGEKRDIVVQIHNSSSRPIRILGLAEC
jgi:uncharacterized protein (DUF58 family)